MAMIWVAGALLPLASSVIYPYLPGAHDPLAVPVSPVVQVAAMANAAVLIDDLERHRTLHGRYPTSLAAVSPDYKVGVVGIAQYHYTSHGEGYTLHFEQPLPMLGDVGTREFAAYHPNGEHLVLSHATWHVTRSPAALAAGQGWYAVRETSRRGWKRFLFD